MSTENELTVKANNEMMESAVAREMQQVQGQIVMAKKFPRDIVSALENIKTACGRKRLATVALYQYNRGGGDIKGPSIRLAETIAQLWGNIDYGIREVEQKNGESRFETYAWDLETNVRSSRTFVIKHERHSKNKVTNEAVVKQLTDPRDIYEVVANNGARRLRACILSVIPSYVTEDALIQIEKTQKANCVIDDNSIKTLIETFSEVGVSREALEKFIGRKIEAIEPALMMRLQRIFISIRDGMGTPADWFDMGKDAPNSETFGDDKTVDPENKKRVTRGKAAPVVEGSIEGEKPEDNGPKF